jgi:hypothetical protein
LSRQCLRKLSTSKFTEPPPGVLIVCDVKSTVSCEPGDLVAAEMISSHWA